MPFDGSGNFTRLFDFEQDRDNGLNILASRVDGEFDNFANALSQVFLRSGALPFTGDLNLGANRLIGLGSGSAANPSLRFNSDATSGVFLERNGVLGLSGGGYQIALFSASAVQINGALTASADVRGRTFRGIPTAGQAPTTAASAQQIIAGEDTDNAVYRAKFGYWYNAGQWRGVIDVIAGGAGTPAPLDIQPQGGPTFFGGPVRALALGAASLNVAGNANQPYISFTRQDDQVRYGYLQHLGAGGDFLYNNEQAGGKHRFNAGGSEIVNMSQGAVSVNVPLQIQNNAGVSTGGSGTFNAGVFVDGNFYMYRPNGLLCDLSFDGGDVMRYQRDINQWNWFINSNSIAGLNASVLTHSNDITAGRNIVANATVKGNAVQVGDNPVWHRGNFNPASYAQLETNVAFRDVYSNRGDGTGVFYLGGNTSYVYFNRSASRMELVVDNTLVATFSATEARFRGEVRGNLGGAIG